MIYLQLLAFGLIFDSVCGGMAVHVWVLLLVLIVCLFMVLIEVY